MHLTTLPDEVVLTIYRYGNVHKSISLDCSTAKVDGRLRTKRNCFFVNAVNQPDQSINHDRWDETTTADTGEDSMNSKLAHVCSPVGWFVAHLF